MGLLVTKKAVPARESGSMVSDCATIKSTPMIVPRFSVFFRPYAFRANTWLPAWIFAPNWVRGLAVAN